MGGPYSSGCTTCRQRKIKVSHHLEEVATAEAELISSATRESRYAFAALKVGSVVQDTLNDPSGSAS
jgi:hypothetical protein